MFPLSLVIRIYIYLSIVVLLGFFLVLTSVDVILEPVWILAGTERESIFKSLYITVIMMSIATIVFAVFVAIFIQDRGINKYNDFLRRFDNMGSHAFLKLSMLQFPNHDEFGNLGQKLNKFLKKVEYYDETKSDLALLEKKKFQSLADLTDLSILLIDTRSKEPYISYYNHEFKELFLRKNTFIDNSGKTKVQYSMIEDRPVVNLVVKNTDEPFLNEIQMHQISNNTILWDKPHIIVDPIYSDLLGEKKYQFKKVICIPLNNTVDQVMYQMLYIFVKPTLLDKNKS